MSGWWPSNPRRVSPTAGRARVCSRRGGNSRIDTASAVLDPSVILRRDPGYSSRPGPAHRRASAWPPKLAQARQQRRQRHRRAIDEQLGKIRQRIGRGQLHGKDEIGVRVGKRQQVQSRQALQARHPGRRLRLRTRPRQGCSRSRSRRYLCGAHEPRQAGHERRRRGPQLQATEPSGTGLSFVQDPGS